MKILVIDNYDSFTYNLVQYLQELGVETVCYRNDKLTLSDAAKMRINRIVISPGPGRPKDAGISCSLIEKFYKKIPILGVCLGHQCIGSLFGAKIIKASEIMHGKISQVYHNRKDIFKGIKNPFEATRYHSLVIDKKTLPSNMELTAWTKEEVIMGVKEKKYPLFGVQFHPESIMTHEGKKLLKNFLNI
ncbi:MAG: anthranilate/aminodeoxychorismate synthase component II [Candidatus Omnitrophica bacterium]|nr:anthranilate/aminodeoxychorismate synthase component II [Candidatus Omnitrophota bacterium]MBD3268637.1 anthranilate/aminodeoxychorismate synthase component II [Candidatus Omnitrophota bacterium]